MTVEETMQRANAAYAAGKLPEAEELCKSILAKRSDFLPALSLMGVLKAQTGLTEEAAVLLRRVVQAIPTNAVAHNNYGNILRDLQRYDAALASYDEALRLMPDYAEAYNNRGSVLYEMKRFDEALSSYDQALRHKRDYGEAHYCRGVVLQHLNRLDEAVTHYKQAIAINPHSAGAHYNLGNAFRDLRQYEEARRSYENALAINPRFAEAYNNRGNVLRELGHHDAALQSYRLALDIAPDLVEAYVNRGGVLQDGKRLNEGLESYLQAVKLKPDYDWLRGAYLHTKMLLCDWSNHGAEAVDLLSRVAQGKRAAPPSTVLALSDDPALQLRAAQTAAVDSEPVGTSLPAMMKPRPRDKIRIGYYSADYYSHATAHLAAGLFECHDTANFQLVAFSFGPDKRDAMAKRLSAAFEQFIDVRAKSDRQVAQLSRDLSIDIAVDLKGFTHDARPGIFAHRAAPLQVNFLGYPGSMGARYIDYIIADQTLISTTSRPYYSESVVYLPGSYQVNDRKRFQPQTEPMRAPLGLPADAFVFCCFNSSYKITPAVFDCWMRILRSTERSVLWLLGDNASTAANLRKEAQARAVDSRRLIFAPYVPVSEHLSRLRAADLFIDTFPCNAHTTASDALWTGVPVLTRCGQSFASRVAASLLNGIGLPELVATTEEQYEQMAIRFAGDPELLANAKTKLRENRLTTSLFDTEMFSRHLEDAYQQIYARYHAGQGASDIYIGTNARKSVLG